MMGTNFYWKPNEENVLPAGLGSASDLDESSPRVHIGKRSAAGSYCWDCGIPLVKTPRTPYMGDSGRWTSSNIHGGREDNRLSSCPDCGAEQGSTRLTDAGSPAGIELGFARPLATRPRGVAGASSFSWTQEPARVLLDCLRWPNESLVIDEYGRIYTGEEFLKMIFLVPLWFTESIGGVFS